jgi:2-polyprenyl-3-methyl-5-hydroxy-6-metoxy-1,4-benzoquinol methylase
MLFPLQASEFASLNWTYVANFAERLKIAQNAVYPVVRCAECGFVFAQRLPSEAFLHTVYEEIIDTRLALTAARNSQGVARRMQYVSRLTMLRPPTVGMTALDYGCGFGVTARLLADAGYRVIAFDPSQARRDAAVTANSSITTVATKNDLRRLGPYQVVVIDNVLEHVADPRRVIGSIAELCDQEAVIYISVPSYEADRIARLLQDYRTGRLNDQTLNPWEHLNYFSLVTLDRAMASFGFAPLRAADEKISYVDVGLRPESRRVPRLKNALASVLRLVRYACTGRGAETVEDRLYLSKGRPAS